MKSYPDTQVMDQEFFGVMSFVLQTIQVVSSPEMLKSTHTELEQYVAVRGREFCRALMQAHFDLRANAERPVPVTDADNVARGQLRPGCPRDLMTLFGEVVVNRIRYWSRGLPSLFPMDRDLNLPVDKYSHGIRRLIMDPKIRTNFSRGISNDVSTETTHG